jgi:hypothetical protein
MLIKTIYQPITIFGNIANFSSCCAPTKNIKYSNVSFLKSMLQKAIRRKDVSVAVRCARHLIDIDEVSFLRRLAIIIVEDTILLDHYSTIIWFLVAVSSHKFHLQLNHKEWLLGLIYSVADAPYYDNIYRIFKMDEIKNNFLDDLEKMEIKKSEYSVLISLEIRRAFGGLKCDMIMIKKNRMVWTQRFEQRKHADAKLYCPIIRCIEYKTDDLDHDEWILESIDIHCLPKILDWSHEKYPEISKEYFRSLIWFYRSSINNHTFVQFYIPKKPALPHNWKDISRSLDSICRYAIKNMS